MTLIRRMEPCDIAAADRAWRLAFGTAFRLPDPLAFRGDGEVLAARSAAWPEGSFVAEVGGEVVGSITGLALGSVVGLGPLTVHPAHQRGGIARELLAAFLSVPAVRDARLTALFTFPDSPAHIRLYESLGFAPDYLTAVLGVTPSPQPPNAGIRRFSALDADAAERCLDGCRAVARAVFEGLDPTREIISVRSRQLGETLILVDRAEAVTGFAICHTGPRTEAGSGLAFVKLGAVRPGAEGRFDELLAACESHAAEIGATRLRAGVNTARRAAYARMRSRGFVLELLGISMHRPDIAGWNAPRQFVIDDFR